LLDLPLGLMAVAYVAQPNARDLEQLREIVSQRSLKVFQVSGKTRPKVLRHFKVIEANRMAQTVDPNGD